MIDRNLQKAEVFTIRSCLDDQDAVHRARRFQACVRMSADNNVDIVKLLGHVAVLVDALMRECNDDINLGAEFVRILLECFNGRGNLHADKIVLIDKTIQLLRNDADDPDLQAIFCDDGVGLVLEEHGTMLIQ